MPNRGEVVAVARVVQGEYYNSRRQLLVGNDFLGALFVVTISIFASVTVLAGNAFPQISSMTSIGAMALLVGVFPIAIVFSTRPTMILIIGIATILTLTLAQEATFGEQVYVALLRYAVSFTAIFLFLVSPAPLAARAISIVASVLICGAAGISLASGPYQYAGTGRFAPFWEGIHSSALTMAAAVVIVGCSSLRLWMRVPVVAIGVVLLLGLGVSTAIIMVCIFAVGWLFDARGWSRSLLIALSAVLVVSAGFYRYVTDPNRLSQSGVEAFGSGRVGAWTERIVNFWNRNFVEQLIGTGPYSDYIVTTLWWWEPKNAHSDLVTLLMEYGLIGLGVILAVGVYFYRRCTPLGQIALLAVLFGASLSNAILERPMVAIFWGLAIYMANSRSWPPVMSEASARIDGRIARISARA